jgi:hypothetical protein
MDYGQVNGVWFPRGRRCYLFLQHRDHVWGPPSSVSTVYQKQHPQLVSGSRTVDLHGLVANERSTGTLQPIATQVSQWISYLNINAIFYFVVLHPVMCTCSRSLEEPPPHNSTSRCLSYILYISTATCFGPWWPSSGRIHNYFGNLLHLQRIQYIVV